MRIGRIVKELKNTRGEIIVHISDTPSMVISYVVKLVNRLGARYLIHTGDFVDEMKSSHPLYSSKGYSKKLENLIRKLTLSSAEYIYMIPGNHDEVEFISGFSEKIKIIPEGTVIEIDNLVISTAHKYENLKIVNQDEKRVIYMYGHNCYSVDSMNYLNGYCSINVIATEPYGVFKLKYPFLTDVLRGNYSHFRKGL